MRIEELVPIRFGRLRGEPLGLQPGLNLICGPNESGKSTYAALIRFLPLRIQLAGEKASRTRCPSGQVRALGRGGRRGSMVYSQNGRALQAAPGALGVEGVFGVRRGDLAAPVAFLASRGRTV